MVRDNQVRYLMKLKQGGKTLKLSSLKSGVSEKTARQYLQSGKLPSECQANRNWRTHPDLFLKVWREVERQLELNPGLQAKTLFYDLQRRYPGPASRWLRLLYKNPYRRIAAGSLTDFRRFNQQVCISSGPVPPFPATNLPGCQYPESFLPGK